VTYDGTEHTVTGYDLRFSDNRYSSGYVSFNGSASASQTIVGTKEMNLSADDFSNLNAGFNVTFVLEADGWMKVTPKAITVTITGNSSTDKYDGNPHTVTGYTATTTENKFDVNNDISFTGEATATQTNAGTKNGT
jgi:hypothetical protein